MNRNHVWAMAAGAVAFGAATAGGCSSSSSSASTASGSSTSTTGSTGGSTSASTTGSTGGSTSASSTTASTAASSSGAGTGGAGTGGGATVTCLDASKYPDTFTIMDPALCAVAVYTANEGVGFQAPSWGSHGGPLVVTADAAGGGVTLERWTAPAGTTGALTKATTHFAAGVPTGAYLGAQANDLPFFGWTAISWSGPSPSTAGVFEMLTSTAVGPQYTANGPYAVAGIASSGGQGRLLYTGLSPLGSPATDANGLYAADGCATPTPSLGTGCATPILVSAWGENSGPVAVDKAGDAFAVLTTSSTGMQEARGFAASTVARGAAATAGTSLFTIAGFSGSLAAVTPAAAQPGLLVFQPFDSTTYAPLDVVVQRFTTTSGVAAMGTTTKLLVVPAGVMNGFTFFTDTTDRLWVAVPGTASTTYVVLARTP